MCQLFEFFRSNKEQICPESICLPFSHSSPKYFKCITNLFWNLYKINQWPHWRCCRCSCWWKASLLFQILWRKKQFWGKMFPCLILQILVLRGTNHRPLMASRDEIPSHKEVPPNIQNCRQNHRIIVTLLEKPYAHLHLEQLNHF